MHNKIRQHKYLFHFILSAGLFLSRIQDSRSQRNEKCSQAFQCGGIPNINYPFWGSNIPEICGFPGFELLNCQGDAPLLNIDSRSYRVLEIDSVTRSLRVARLDLWNNTCPSVLHNTTLDLTLFEPPSVDSYENVTLYYDCTIDQFQAAINLNNQFTCHVDGAKTVNLLAPGEPSERGSNIICSNNISVPVNLSAARALSSPSASINDLRDALASGFSVHWLEKISNCEGCLESDGVCGNVPYSPSTQCNITHSAEEVVVGGGRSWPPSLGTLVPKLTPQASPPNSGARAPKGSPSLVPVDGPGPSTFPFYYADTRDAGASGLFIMDTVLIRMAIIVAVIVAAAFIIVCLKRQYRPERLRNGNKETNQNVENFLLNNEYLAPKRYRYSQIKKITKSFRDKLGQGGY